MKFKLLRSILTAFLILLCVTLIMVLSLNFLVVFTAKKNIVSTDYNFDNGYDCIVILGCGLKSDGKPSRMLEDRLVTGIELYKNGAAPKLLMSGDHGSVYYDEVGTMKEYAVNNGVPSEDIFLDHAGFSTYESMYRAMEIFGADKILVVTQEYHLYRAVYVANSLGIDAVGVPCVKKSYRGQFYREIREILARDKDVFSCIFNVEPKYLGEKIPVIGNGNVTNG